MTKSGARQIGKTESILHFANEQYTNVVYINFALEKKFMVIVNDGYDVATTLKAFRIDGRYDVICSGSILGINYKKIHSNSVGNKTDYEMFSMDFEEFLMAKGYHEEQIADILKHMKDMKPFSEIELNVYKSLFLDYCVLGGIPAVSSG